MLIVESKRIKTSQMSEMRRKKTLRKKSAGMSLKGTAIATTANTRPATIIEEPSISPAYVSIRQRTSAYASIRQHTSAYGVERE